MHWVRVAKISVFLTAFIALVAGGPLLYGWISSELDRRAELPDPIVASQEDTQAIIDVVLDHMEYVGIPPPPPEDGQPSPTLHRRTLVLADESICFLRNMQDKGCQSGPTDSLLGIELDSLSPKKLREELALANQATHQLKIRNAHGAVVVPSSTIDRIFATGWWEDFYRTYPDTAGYARVSLPVLTKDRNKALIYVDHRCGDTCGLGSIHLLERTGNTWRITKEEILWVS